MKRLLIVVCATSFLACLVPLQAGEEKPSASDPVARSSLDTPGEPTLIFNQHLLEGWHAPAPKIDLTEPADVFFHIFERLPDEVYVYPGENYYYWKLLVDGREIRGNIRLPAGARDRGVLSFGYSEYEEFPSVGGGGKRLSHAKYFTRGDGVEVERVDGFTYVVRVLDKEVVFHLNRISQHPPTSFELLPDEEFVQRTFDESGFQFFLLFNKRHNYFLWVLDEEGPVPEHFTKLADDVVVGNRTGFVFWLDPNADRKILATIRRISVMRNDYYDGPFDQLSDNHVDTGEIDIRSYMERAIPSIRGRIDRYGYYTDTESPSRVALSNYGSYYTFSEAIAFIEKAKEAFDPYYYISRGGYPPTGLRWDGAPAGDTSRQSAADSKDTTSADGS